MSPTTRVISTGTPALVSLPRSRRAILEHLKREGEARAEDIADALEITVSGVRQHLSALAADGLVDHSEVKHGPGRPAHVYRLTPASESFFPKAYGQLTNELLGYVADSDPELVAQVFAQRGRRRIELARARLRGLTLGEKVAELTQILDEDGYVASCEQVDAGTWLIVEHNCAIFAVALEYGNACSSEIQFIRRVLPDATVERVEHMVEGAHRCAYRVTAKQ